MALKAKALKHYFVGPQMKRLDFPKATSPDDSFSATEYAASG